jgi:hypothetical protein
MDSIDTGPDMDGSRERARIERERFEKEQHDRADEQEAQDRADELANEKPFESPGPQP